MPGTALSEINRLGGDLAPAGAEAHLLAVGNAIFVRIGGGDFHPAFRGLFHQAGGLPAHGGVNGIDTLYDLYIL